MAAAHVVGCRGMRSAGIASHNPHGCVVSMGCMVADGLLGLYLPLTPYGAHAMPYPDAVPHVNVTCHLSRLAGVGYAHTRLHRVRTVTDIDKYLRLPVCLPIHLFRYLPAQYGLACSLAYWPAGLLVCRSAGLLACWAVHGSTDSPVHQSAWCGLVWPG